MNRASVAHKDCIFGKEGCNSGGIIVVDGVIECSTQDTNFLGDLGIGGCVVVLGEAIKARCQ